MQTTRVFSKLSTLGLRASCALTLALLVAACEGGGGRDGEARGAARSEDSAYVVATAVSSSESANTYVKVLPSIEHAQLELDDAHEFAGWSDMAVLGRWVFVSSGEEPVITRFAVNDDGSLEEDGELSFSNFTDDANFYSQRVISAEKAYLTGEDKYVVWNPTTLEITGEIPLPVFEPVDAIMPSFAGDRGMVVRGDRLFHAVNWLDTENYRMAPTSRIVVVDLERDEVIDTLEVDCPDLDVGDLDEKGNIYFTSWVYAPAATVLSGDSNACLVRIRAGSESIDPDWTISFQDITGGHEAATVAYLGRGKLLTSVFYEDNQEFDPNRDEMFDWIFGNNWKMHTIDIETKTLGDVDGIGWNGGGYYPTRFDDLTRVLVPSDSYTTTAMYAISDDGSVTPELEMSGWSTRLFKLR
jgi:hypothetical protein